MKRFTLLILSITLLLVKLSTLALEPHFAQEPQISPDGKTICFEYLGDLWTAPFEGGEAKRLTATKYRETNPIFSPDSKWICYLSNKEGTSQIFKIPVEGGEGEMVFSEYFWITDWSKDGKYLLGTKTDFLWKDSFYKIPLTGERPTIITEFGGDFGTFNEDNTKILFSRNGYPYREAYKGSLNGELWEYDIENNKYEQLTDTDYTERYAVYSHKEKGYYYAAAVNDLFQLFFSSENNFKKREQLTNFTDNSVRNISISNDDQILFQKFDELWRYNPSTQKAEKINIEIKEEFLPSFDIKRKVFSGFSRENKSFDVSHDGKWIAFAYKYDLFAMPEEEGEVKQITFDSKGIDAVKIMNDNRTILYTSYDKGYQNLFKVNIEKPDSIDKVKFFDDKYVEAIAVINDSLVTVNFTENNKMYQQCIYDFKNDKIEFIDEKFPIASGSVSISPHKNYLIYNIYKNDYTFTDSYAYDREEKIKHKLFPFYGWPGNTVWSKDGKYIFFNFEGDIYKLENQAQREKLYDDKYVKWSDIFKEDKKKDKKTGSFEISVSADTTETSDADSLDTEIAEKEDKDKKDLIDFDNIEDRFTKFVNHNGYNEIIAVTKDSCLYYVNHNSIFDKHTLKKIDFDGKNDKEIYTLPDDISDLKYHEKNKVFYFVNRNTLYKVTTTGKETLLNNKFKYSYNEIELNKSIFQQVWGEYGKWFYDMKMHGQDWNELYDKYIKYMDYSYDPNIMGRIISELIGDVNASHSEFSPRRKSYGKFYYSAFIGCTFDYSTNLEEGIKIREVYHKSQLNKPYNIHTGDILLEVDGEKIDNKTSLNDLFLDKIGEVITLKIKSGDDIKEIQIKGLSWWGMYQLAYDTWVDKRYEMTEDFSKGKIGYAHIPQMNQDALADFVQDIFAKNWEKKALIIDIRYNGGGNIHDELTELLTKKAYSYNSHRLYSGKKTKFPYNVWDKPIILMINEYSASDAEVFPMIFKELKLGKTVGMPTSGYVIGTWGHKLMDGSRMRLPAFGWYTLKGKDLENNGVEPDILVKMSPENYIEDNDVQLQKAVKELLKKIK